MPWKTPYGKGVYQYLPIEVRKFWIEVLNYSIDDILGNDIQSLPIQFKDLTILEKQFLFESVINTLFGDEHIDENNAYLDMAATVPFSMFEIYIENEELSTSTLFYWIHLLISAWDSLKIKPNNNYIFELYPLFRKKGLLKILQNAHKLTDMEQINLMDIIEPYKDMITEHLINYLDDIRDALFWSEDWTFEQGWILHGDRLNNFLKHFEIYDFYYEKLFIVEDYTLYIVCPCHKTKKKIYHNQLFNKIAKMETDVMNTERDVKSKFIVNKLAREQAALVIQKNCHRWLWSPKCKDGKPGINCRLGWDSVQNCNQSISNTEVNNFTKIIDCKIHTEDIEKDIKEQIINLQECNLKFKPKLVIIQIGNNPNESFSNSANKCGIELDIIQLDNDVLQTELLSLILKLNDDNTVHGIIVQIPLSLSSQYDEYTINDTIDPKKDINGFHSKNFSNPYFVSGITKGCLELFKNENIKLHGKTVVVLGFNNIVGLRVLNDLSKENATIILCNSYTNNVDNLIRQADIVIVDIINSPYINSNWIKDGTIIVEVGLNSLKDLSKVFGEMESLRGLQIYNRVGYMTISMLMQNTFLSAKASF